MFFKTISCTTKELKNRATNNTVSIAMSSLEIYLIISRYIIFVVLQARLICCLLRYVVFMMDIMINCVVWFEFISQILQGIGT